MIYRMDSVEYFRLVKHEPVEALVHTYYASISSRIVTSGRLHPNVFNWSFALPSTRFQIENDYDHELAKSMYYADIASDVDLKVAPILYEILKNGERLIILYTEKDWGIMYPQLFCKYVEERYKLSIYKYMENEDNRPYNVTDALHELKKASKKAYNQKLLHLSPVQLNKKEVKYMLKLFGVEPVGDLEDMQHQYMEIIREVKRKAREDSGIL